MLEMKHKGLLQCGDTISTQEEEQADFCQSKVFLDYRASSGENKEKERKGKTAENSRWDSQEQHGKEMEEEGRDEDTVRHGGQQAAKGQTARLIRNQVKELQRKSKRPSWPLASERRKKS